MWERRKSRSLPGSNTACINENAPQRTRNGNDRVFAQRLSPRSRLTSLPQYSSRARRQHLAGVEDAIGIQRSLYCAHGVERGGVECISHEVTLAQADAVFA